MTRYYPGTDIVYNFQVYNTGILSTPTTAAFQYKIGRDGAWTSVTPVAVSTGVYTATVNPTFGGALFWRWKTTGPAYAEEGMDMIENSEFDTTGYQYDYGFGCGGY